MIPPETKRIPPLTYKKIEKLCFRVNNNDLEFNLMTTKSKASLPLSEKSTNNYFSHSTGPSNQLSTINQAHPSQANYLINLPPTNLHTQAQPQKKIFDAKKYKIEGFQRDKEFYFGARKRLVDMYKDIQANPQKQVCRFLFLF